MLKLLKFIKSINFRTKSRFCFVDQVTLSRSYNIKTIIFFFGISSTTGTNKNCLLNKRNSSGILLSSSLSQSSKTPNGILISKNNENIKNVINKPQFCTHCRTSFTKPCLLQFILQIYQEVSICPSLSD